MKRRYIAPETEAWPHALRGALLDDSLVGDDIEAFINSEQEW